ncbi:hypothetical protein ACLOJK_008309 [Asimina triloba]
MRAPSIPIFFPRPLPCETTRCAPSALTLISSSNPLLRQLRIGSFCTPEALPHHVLDLQRPNPPFSTPHLPSRPQMRRRGKKQEGMKEKAAEVEPQKRRCSSASSSLSAQAPLVVAPEPCFQALPHDVIVRIAGAFTVPNLWAASLVCLAWRDVLRPLREAMVLVRWGKKFKHGHGGVSANVEKALDSFLKGAARGCTPAMVDAGLVYWEMGDKEKAIAWYRKAAELGDPAGQCNLGISYLQANPPRQEEAVQWFHKAALAGHVRAQYNLALSLHQGRGIKRDPPEAQVDADRDETDLELQFLLFSGLLFDILDGTHNAKWYLKAAEGGNPRAMFNTSLCYSSGEGVSVSIRQARKWMKRAADSGHSKAQYEHGLRLFSMGDMVNALVYLELATRAGETAANYVKNVLLQQLPAATRDRAMQTANSWEPTNVSR